MMILDKKLYECFKELGCIPDTAFVSCECFMSMIQNRGWYGIPGSFNHPDDFKKLTYQSAFGVVKIYMDIDLDGWDAYIGSSKDWLDGKLIEKILLRNEDEITSDWGPSPKDIEF